MGYSFLQTKNDGNCARTTTRKTCFPKHAVVWLCTPSVDASSRAAAFQCIAHVSTALATQLLFYFSRSACEEGVHVQSSMPQRVSKLRALALRLHTHTHHTHTVKHAAASEQAESSHV